MRANESFHSHTSWTYVWQYIYHIRFIWFENTLEYEREAPWCWCGAEIVENGMHVETCSLTQATRL